MSESRHHGMKEKPAMEFLCSPESYEYENRGSFGRLFRNVHKAVPLYSKATELKKLGEVDGIMDSKNIKSSTNSVPVGMVFLGQFIDHDITLDTQSSISQINEAGDILNFRTPTLDLDSVFGEGPEDEPFLYLDDSNRLLTGETNNNIGQGPAHEKEDLARNGKGVALIGDPRNDENRVLSQLQLLMIRFYNKVYDGVVAKKLSNLPAGLTEKDLDKKEIYEEARKLVTWHYQWIVINEFLPIMVGSDLMNDIMSNGRKWYTPKSLFIPVEFSVAAYRFGHSMVPQELALQKNGDIHPIFSAAFGIGFKPISDDIQVVHWERFFNIDGTHQFADKLDTKLATILLDLPFIRDPDASKRSLATRNLTRGNSFLIPSGETVAKCMGLENDDRTTQVKVALAQAFQNGGLD